MLGRITNKVTVVTGAAQGIGEGIAKTFSAAGSIVVLADKSVEQAERVANEIKQSGGEALFVETDLAEKSQIDFLVEETIRHFGRLDILIHNAAVFPMFTVEELTKEALDLTLDVNLKPAFWFTQKILPYFRQQGGGRLIFTSSVTGPKVAMPGTAHYAASKAGLNGFIKTAALELAAENITVNGVEPGYISTAAMEHLGDAETIEAMAKAIPAGQLGKPADIANAMLFLASDEAAYITGQTITVDGGSTLPESVAL